MLLDSLPHKLTLNAQARTVEGGRKWIGAMLKEESSIAQQFGEDSHMCVRI